MSKRNYPGCLFKMLCILYLLPANQIFMHYLVVSGPEGRDGITHALHVHLHESYIVVYLCKLIVAIMESEHKHTHTR